MKENKIDYIIIHQLDNLPLITKAMVEFRAGKRIVKRFMMKDAETALNYIGGLSWLSGIPVKVINN